MRPSKLSIDDLGIVKIRKTGKIFTIINDPTPKRRRRFFFRMWKKWILKEWRDITRAAGYSTGGGWNH